MKRLLPILAISLVLAGCEKGAKDSSSSSESPLVGIWCWTESITLDSGSPSTGYFFYEFNADHTGRDYLGAGASLTWSLSGDKLKIRSEGGDYDCQILHLDKKHLAIKAEEVGYPGEFFAYFTNVSSTLPGVWKGIVNDFDEELSISISSSGTSSWKNYDSSGTTENYDWEIVSLSIMPVVKFTIPGSIVSTSYAIRYIDDDCGWLVDMDGNSIYLFREQVPEGVVFNEKDMAGVWFCTRSTDDSRAEIFPGAYYNFSPDHKYKEYFYDASVRDGSWAFSGNKLTLSSTEGIHLVLLDDKHMCWIRDWGEYDLHTHEMYTNLTRVLPGTWKASWTGAWYIVKIREDGTSTWQMEGTGATIDYNWTLDYVPVEDSDPVPVLSFSGPGWSDQLTYKCVTDDMFVFTSAKAGGSKVLFVRQ